MLQFVSNQVGEFPDLFEDQMNSAGSMQTGGASTASRPAIQTPQTTQTPNPPVYQSSSVGLAPSQTLSTQSLPLTPPLTPAQAPSPTTTSTTGQQQMTRTPPLLQPRPQVVQPIQPQQAAQPTIQVSESHISTQILWLGWILLWFYLNYLLFHHNIFAAYTVMQHIVSYLPKGLHNWWRDRTCVVVCKSEAVLLFFFRTC